MEAHDMRLLFGTWHVRPGASSTRLTQWSLLAVLLASGCQSYFARDSKPDSRPTTPSAMCNNCCAQAFDACKLDISEFPAAICPPRFQECKTACESGDENEMCVIQTNRELASHAPAVPAGGAPVARRPAPRIWQGQCDHKGTWSLSIAAASGNAKGCTALASIPKEVSFRIGRRRDVYVLYDLAPVPGWNDAFTVENSDKECVVTLQRDNRTDPGQSRSLAVKLKEHDRAVSGTLSYGEANQPAGCALDAQVVGSVVPPPPTAAPPAPPAVTTTPAPSLQGGGRR
jgi:hypothetical protein